MLKNFVQVAIRNIYRNSFYSIINVVGLASGLACSMLILLWVADEISFNRFHQNYDNIFRVCLNLDYSGTIYTSQNTPYPIKAGLKIESPHITRTAITNNGEGNLLVAGDKRVNKYGYAVSQDFLRMFTFDVVSGAHETALDDPTSIVITEETALSLFGTADVIGRSIVMDNKDELHVSAVVRNVPPQSTIQFDFLISFTFYETIKEWVRDASDEWENNSFQVYVQLDNAASEADVNKEIGGTIASHAPERSNTTVFLHPMTKWRLYSEFDNGKISGGMIEYVRLF